MTIAARSGRIDGAMYFIETKTSGEVRAEVNKKRQSFATVTAAMKWIDDEIKRRNRK